jgi:hypothetical protein
VSVLHFKIGAAQVLHLGLAPLEFYLYGALELLLCFQLSFVNFIEPVLPAMATQSEHRREPACGAADVVFAELDFQFQAQSVVS